jgi:hypothetical protein
LFRLARKDGSSLDEFAGPSMIDSPAFDFNPASRALPEAQNKIRLAADQSIDELLTMKAHRKNMRRQSRPAR